MIMKVKIILITAILICFTREVMAQTTTPSSPSIFESISTELKDYKIDTSAVPTDKITSKIIQLRQLKGGFNIDEAIAFKIGEEKSKGEISTDELKKLAAYFTTGHGHVLLGNAVIWIYRQEFSYKELKTLIKFYKTGAGQKMSKRFPVIMLKSFAAAEIIKAGIKR